MEKQYKTRDGRDVRLLCVDAGGKFPVVAIVDNAIIRYSNTGYYLYSREELPMDLIEVVPERSRFYNMYRDQQAFGGTAVSGYRSLDAARRKASASGLSTWEGSLEKVYLGNELVDVKFHPAA